MDIIQKVRDTDVGTLIVKQLAYDMFRKGSRSCRVPTENRGSGLCPKYSYRSFSGPENIVELRRRSAVAAAAVCQPSASSLMPPRAGFCGRLDNRAAGVADRLNLLMVTYSLGRCC